MTKQSVIEITNQLINRLQDTTMSWYTVTRDVTANWPPAGVFPFSVNLNNNIATFTIYAASQENAEDQVNRYTENK